MTVSPPLNPIMMLLEGNGSLAGRDRAGAFTATGSGALRYAVAPGARTNLIKNPSVETDTTNWSAVNSGVLSRNASLSVSGSACGQIATNSGHANQGARSSTTGSRVLFGQTVTASVYLRVLTGVATAVIDITEFNAAGTSLGVFTASGVLSLTTDWQRFSVTRTMANANVENAALTIYTNVAQTVSILFDAAMLEVVASPSDYFDGTTGVWLDPLTGMLGTPHASASVSRAQFWVEEATTNLIPNPSAEVDTSFGSVTALAALSRDTTAAYLGVASYKVITTSATLQRFVTSTVSALGFTGAASVFTASAWLKGSGSVRVWIAVTYTDASTASATAAVHTLSSAWTRITMPSITVDPAKTVQRFDLSFQDSAQAGITFNVDAIQVEQKAYATSYCDGSLGTGYTWAGTAHASASTRAAARVSFTIGTRVNSVLGSAVARVVRNAPSAGTNRIVNIGNYGAAINDSIILFTSGSNFQTLFYSNSAYGGGSGVSALTMALDTPYKVYGGWTSLLGYAGELGGVIASGARNQTPTGVFNSTAFDLMTVAGSANNFSNGLISQVAIYDAPLSAARRTMVNAAIDSNGATDLWTLFEEWETTLSPFDLFDLETISGGAGVVASLSPIDLFDLEAGVAGSGVRALIDPLDFGFDYEDVIGASPIPLPASIDWDDASSPLVTWSTD